MGCARSDVFIVFLVYVLCMFVYVLRAISFVFAFVTVFYVMVFASAHAH